MTPFVMIGRGEVGNALFPNRAPATVLVFTCFDWDLGDGMFQVPNQGRGAGFRIARQCGAVVAEASRDHVVFCKGPSLSVIVQPGEQEALVLKDIQSLIRAHGGLGDDVEFLDTGDDNQVLLTVMLGTG